MKLRGCPPLKGGKRQAITNFSASSHRHLLRELSSIDRSKAPAPWWRFITLTYHLNPPGPREAKLHLKRFKQRFERRWGKCPGFWKLEPQKRGAPHFHLMVLMGLGDAERHAQELVWVAETWAEIAGGNSLQHSQWHLGQLGNGNRPCVEVMRDWQGVASYTSKYLGKVVDGSTWEKPGRWWGKWNAEGLKELITIAEAEIPTQVAKVVRRTLVRAYEHQPSGRTKLVKVNSKGVRKVLRGYFDRQQLGIYAECEYSARPYHRRWKSSRGGASMFMPAEAFKKLLLWAWREVSGERGLVELRRFLDEVQHEHVDGDGVADQDEGGRAGVHPGVPLGGGVGG